MYNHFLIISRIGIPPEIRRILSKAWYVVWPVRGPSLSWAISTQNFFRARLPFIPAPDTRKIKKRPFYGLFRNFSMTGWDKIAQTVLVSVEACQGFSRKCRVKMKLKVKRFLKGEKLGHVPASDAIAFLRHV